MIQDTIQQVAPTSAWKRLGESIDDMREIENQIQSLISNIREEDAIEATATPPRSMHSINALFENGTPELQDLRSRVIDQLALLRDLLLS